KKGLPKQVEVESDRQMALYTLAVREGWPEFARVRVRMVYLKQKMTFRAEIDPETIELIREQTLQDILEIKSAERRDDFAPKESGLCNWCEFYSLCPAKRHRIMLEDEVAVSEPAVYARDLADKYLTIKQRMDSDKAELDQLKLELADLARELELAVVEGNAGRIKFTDREVEAFPTKTADKAAVAEIGALVRQADPDLYDVFAELNLNALLKALLKDQLPAPLAEKLNAFIIKKRQLTARTSLLDPEEITESSD
ncbi:MAG TPA: PD-(D/E)XK nuclease family protein, partial [candidate division Zixibacteria bacterium]|nr:PD-(D/E)XK nuclease family protein [candidate division Zixibacteria bacterium]